MLLFLIVVAFAVVGDGQRSSMRRYPGPRSGGSSFRYGRMAAPPQVYGRPRGGREASASMDGPRRGSRRVMAPGRNQEPGAFEEEADPSTGGRFQKWYGRGEDIDARRGNSAEDAFKATRTEAYWQRNADNLNKLKAGGTTTQEKMMIIKTLTDEQNVVAKGEKAGVKIFGGQGGGNCAMSTISTIMSLGFGQVSCALGQQRGIPANFDAQKKALVDLRWYVRDASFNSGRAEDLLQNLNDLREGQIAYVELWTSDRSAGHAVAAIRLDGTLYTINNQGWDRNIQGLEKLADFIPRLFRAVSKQPGTMRLILTNVVIPK